MRFIFVDAENIGNKELDSIKAEYSDKVLVFAKNQQAQVICEKRLFTYLSGYETGPNQADFYIVANLGGSIASLTAEQLPVCEFILYSRDQHLVNAFVFQCKLHDVKHSIACKPKSTTSPTVAVEKQPETTKKQ